MVEVFITNIKEPVQAKALTNVLSTDFPQLKIDIDLWDSELPYPCGHTVLRVEGVVFESENIISTVQKSGFLCDILEDKICPKEE